MPVYIKFQLRVYFSFYLAFLVGDRHSPALPYIGSLNDKKAKGKSRLRVTIMLLLFVYKENDNNYDDNYLSEWYFVMYFWICQIKV
jgi:hypothetical protein